MNEETVEERIKLSRSKVRAAIFLILVSTLCAALFILEDVRELVVAYAMGAANVAAIFYFEEGRSKSESGSE